MSWLLLCQVQGNKLSPQYRWSSVKPAVVIRHQQKPMEETLGRHDKAATFSESRNPSRIMRDVAISKKRQLGVVVEPQAFNLLAALCVVGDLAFFPPAVQIGGIKLGIVAG